MKIKFKKKLFNDKEIFITKHYIWIFISFLKVTGKTLSKNVGLQISI